MYNGSYPLSVDVLLAVRIMWEIVTFYFVCLPIAWIFNKKSHMSSMMLKRGLSLLKKKLFFKDHCSNLSWPFKNISCFIAAHKSGTLTGILLGPDHQLRFIHKIDPTHFGFFPVNGQWLLGPPWSTGTPSWLILCSQPPLPHLPSPTLYCF